MSSEFNNAQTRHVSAHAELQWALNLRSPNVLIIGAPETDVARVQAGIDDPVTVIADAFPEHLDGTCIVLDARRLIPEQQHALRRRLDREPALRVITVSAVPLYPFVEAGQFDETLYYRLNTITIHLTAESPAVA